MHLSARLSFFALIATTLLTGCSLTNTATPGISTGAKLKGNVHGGQQPVVGSHIYLFAAGTSGYGGPSVSLLNSNTDGTDSLGSYVLSDANGGFSITGDYTCTAGAQAYLLAVGGNPGLPAPQTNPNLALMTNLGQCPASGSFAANIPTVQINEVTTIASVYAISGFMTDLTHVSSSGTPLALTGIANAFATTNNLVNITTGTALVTTPAGNGTVPQTKINTLANIIATCVNSTGAGSTPCTTLFSTALNGAIQPTDTVTAALNIAHNPGIGIAAIYALTTATPPFAPALTTQPNDFTVSLSFTDGTLAYPDYIAIDALGNIWTSLFIEGIGELNGSTGAIISPYNGFSGGGLANPNGIAIDTQGNVWAANQNTNGLTKLSGITGVPISPTTGYNNPPGSGHQIAIDTTGNIWGVDRQGYGVSETNGTNGTAMAGSNTFSSWPTYAIATDSSGYVWIGGGTITKIDCNTGVIKTTNSNFGTNSAYPVTALAIDHSGFVWAASGEGIHKIDGDTGDTISPLPGYTGGGIKLGVGAPDVAIDGLGFVWATNENGISELDGNTGAPISPALGYSDTSISANLAIDGSGNIWVTHFGYSAAITEYVGIAAPVVTPIAAGVANNTLGTRP